MKSIMIATLFLALSMVSNAQASSDAVNDSLTGTYQIQAKSFFSSNNFKLTLVADKNIENGAKRMGTVTLESEDYGTCSGDYTLVNADEAYDTASYVISSTMEWLTCDNNDKVFILVAIPENVQLNKITAPVSGHISIYLNGDRDLDKRMKISLDR